MFHLNGVWHESVEALSLANPTIKVHDNVHSGLFLSPAWDNEALVLPHDAAALLCVSTQTADYYRLAGEANNAEFGKCLRVANGCIIWDGSLSLRSTREITNGKEILATRGYAYWEKHGFPSRV